MSSASYETSTFANPSSAHDIRRSLGGSFSSAYDSPYSTARRRSPSPGPSSRRYAPYDSYIPRGGPSYRSDDHSNIYRPNTWRPECYNSRSPSPDRYDRSRSMEPRFWDSGSRWQSSWQDRRSTPSPPPLREKLRRDTMAERMFEPSDSWKQSHVDRPGRYEALEPPSPRFPDYRARPARDYSPQKSPAYPPTHGDTYRPYSSGQGYREPHVFVRSDSYRPQYDDSTRRSPRSVDKSTIDAHYPCRPSSHYDHDDTRSSTSIASTPPRHAVNSPPPDSHITDHDFRRHSPSCRRASPARSVARSRASSMSSEPPLKRLKSRSSSRSSGSPRPDKCAISARHGLKDIVSLKPNRESTIQQAPTHVLSRNPDRLDSTSNTLTEKGSTHPEPLPHELPHVDAKPVHPVMNGELNGPLTSNFLRSPPTLSSGEDIEMSPPGLISSHTLPSDVEFAFLGDSAGKGTEMQANQTSPLFNEVHSQPISPATPSPALKSVGAVIDDSPASAAPSPESRMPEKDIDVGSSGTLTGDAPLLKSVSQVVATESVGSPSRIEAGEQLLTPDDVEQPATWFYGRPSFADSTAKALRFVVLTRLQCDRQTRDERVIPVLRANRAIREPSLPSPIDAQDKLFQEFAADQPHQERMTLHSQSIRSSLSGHFLEREAAILEKQQKLREEYLELHQQWIAQCARLDNVSKGGLPEESMTTSAGGRSTRRSAAVLGDAVRSDLEMEQIIANLGMEELTDPSYLAIKNVAKIPDMVSVVDGRGPCFYDDTNNLLDNPAEFYSSSSALDLWTEEECIVFRERYAAHPKQFGLIAQHLPNKTAAQCVTYYYLHKPHVDFRKAIAQYGAGRRRRNGRGANKQKGNALLADIRRHDDEVLAALPTSSAVPSKRRRAAILRATIEPRRNQSRRGTVQPDLTPTSSGTTPDPEADEQKRRRRSTAVARSSGLAQEGVEPTEPSAEAPPPKQTRRPRKPRARAVPTPSEEATPAPELPDYFKSSSLPISWSKEDKSLFLELLSQHGDNIHHVAASMPHKVRGDLVAGCGAA